MTPTFEAFRHFSQIWNRACHRYDHVAAQGNRDEIENALAAKQDVEREVSESFILVRRPENMGAKR